MFTDSYIFNNSSQLSDYENLPNINIVAKTYCGDEGLNAFLYENKVPILTVIGTKAVSYTHLDVYKRQDQIYAKIRKGLIDALGGNFHEVIIGGAALNLSLIHI